MARRSAARVGEQRLKFFVSEYSLSYIKRTHLRGAFLSPPALPSLIRASSGSRWAVGEGDWRRQWWWEGQSDALRHVTRRVEGDASARTSPPSGDHPRHRLP